MKSRLKFKVRIKCCLTLKGISEIYCRYGVVNKNQRNTHSLGVGEKKKSDILELWCMGIGVPSFHRPVLFLRGELHFRKPPCLFILSFPLCFCLRDKCKSSEGHLTAVCGSRLSACSHSSVIVLLPQHEAGPLVKNMRSALPGGSSCTSCFVL